jgi:hypothetical protein
MFDIKFGYDSAKDFLTSFFGTWYPVIALVTGTVIGCFYFGITAVVGHVERFWFSPFSALMIVVSSITMDCIFGAYNAWKRDVWNTRLAQRVVPMVIANFLILSLFYNIVKYQISSFDSNSATALGYFGCKIAALYLSGVHTASALKNAVMAGMVNAEWAKWVTSKIDKHKIKADELI